MKKVLVLLFLLVAGCVSPQESNPLESVAAEAPPGAKMIAWADTQKLLSNEHVMARLVGPEGPTQLGMLSFLAPEARAIMTDSPVVGVKTVGLDLLAGVVPLVIEGFKETKYLDKTIYASKDLSFMADKGFVYFGELGAIKKMVLARRSANALLEYSQVISRLPRRDVMVAGKAEVIGGASNYLGLSAFVKEEIASATLVVDAGDGSTAVLVSTLLPSLKIKGVTVNSVQTEGRFVSAQLLIDLEQFEGVGVEGLSLDVPAVSEKKPGPGGCTTEECMQQYCTQHPEECVQWAEQEGLVTGEGVQELLGDPCCMACLAVLAEDPSIALDTACSGLAGECTGDDRTVTDCVQALQ